MYKGYSELGYGSTNVYVLKGSSEYNKHHDGTWETHEYFDDPITRTYNPSYPSFSSSHSFPSFSSSPSFPSSPPFSSSPTFPSPPSPPFSSHPHGPPFSSSPSSSSFPLHPSSHPHESPMPPESLPKDPPTPDYHFLPPGFGSFDDGKGCNCWPTHDDGLKPEVECRCQGQHVLQVPANLTANVDRL
ncbi:hypothetical protein Pmani_025191 [Petrolisthes manimaculis]|uniref:Uncharacterized protein n=1 Tax=Petrolisthes manimaculis TaxID=1843537 RepID=A0AAE1P8R0_9EUCA|nr:hypothetical protein Pmani_025191 [Petrolisthes manimaculis]